MQDSLLTPLSSRSKKQNEFMTDSDRLDKLLHVLTLLLERDLKKKDSGMNEDSMTRAMARALRENKRFIRPRTFGGG